MKKVKIAIGIVLIASLLILTGYFFRVDRFGLSRISWIDCVKINNNKYYSDYERTSIEEALVNKKIGEVKFNVSENVHNGNYKFRNGDATFLEVGTEIYNLKSDDNAIAVKIDNEYFIYELYK